MEIANVTRTARAKGSLRPYLGRFLVRPSLKSAHDKIIQLSINKSLDEFNLDTLRKIQDIHEQVARCASVSYRLISATKSIEGDSFLTGNLSLAFTFPSLASFEAKDHFNIRSVHRNDSKLLEKFLSNDEITRRIHSAQLRLVECLKIGFDIVLDERPPTKNEIERMQRLMDSASQYILLGSIS